MYIYIASWHCIDTYTAVCKVKKPWLGQANERSLNSSFALNYQQGIHVHVIVRPPESFTNVVFPLSHRWRSSPHSLEAVASSVLSPSPLSSLTLPHQDSSARHTHHPTLNHSVTHRSAPSLTGCWLLANRRHIIYMTLLVYQDPFSLTPSLFMPSLSRWTRYLKLLHIPNSPHILSWLSMPIYIYVI